VCVALVPAPIVRSHSCDGGCSMTCLSAYPKTGMKCAARPG
jgi:hypothetical protein